MFPCHTHRRRDATVTSQWRRTHVRWRLFREVKRPSVSDWNLFWIKSEFLGMTQMSFPPEDVVKQWERLECWFLSLNAWKIHGRYTSYPALSVRILDWFSEQIRLLFLSVTLRYLYYSEVFLLSYIFMTARGEYILYVLLHIYIFNNFSY